MRSMEEPVRAPYHVEAASPTPLHAESAPLNDIAALAERHAALGAELAAKREDAASLRVVAELQERLAAFDAQVAAGACALRF